MGRVITNGVESTTVVPIRVDLGENGHGSMPPQTTTKIFMSTRLGGMEDKTITADNAFFAKAAGYNGDLSADIEAGKYSYSEPIQFYDSNGTMRSATVYHDKAGATGGLTSG